MVSMSGVDLVHNEQELFKAIEGILKNGINQRQLELVKKFIYQEAYLQDGKATERVVNLILKTVIVRRLDNDTLQNLLNA